MNDVLDVSLAIIVTRMRFAGEDKLDWPGFVARQLHNIFELLEDQRRAFVGRKPSCEADGQGIRIEQLVEGDEIAVGQPLPLDEKPPASELNQFAPEIVAQRPKF